MGLRASVIETDVFGLMIRIRTGTGSDSPMSPIKLNAQLKMW